MAQKLENLSLDYLKGSLSSVFLMTGGEGSKSYRHTSDSQHGQNTNSLAS